MKTTFSKGKVKAFLEKSWGDIPDFYQLTEGLSSQTFGFQFAKSNYVIRINRSINGFKKDAYVSRMFRSKSLPIPEVVEVDHMENGYAFCISRKADGVRIQDLEKKELPQITESVVDVVRTISNTDLAGTTGFGRFNSKGEAEFLSWNAFLKSIWDPSYYDWNFVSDSFKLSTIEKMFKRVEELSKFCPEKRSLIHGDFGSYNVLTDKGHVTAVIDWDLSLFGDPLYELATLLFWNENHMAHVIKELQLSSDTMYASERLLCYQLHCGLQELHMSTVNQGTDSLLPWITKRCMELVRLK
ncbi:hypothetical protein J14TS2_34440 [Bacillus sp. J14TS2]|uniref:phosphotransferase family protein n=1 Tax=Bacillus sp. J14TS2 TaxID=2807188 RepID=UPI001B2D5D48|nr:aminoglycoside phosphotransferase family protein [Bacillus sp. J14TS2]GIN72969.1 hypothetical protein J14TS2_34440 [Bacillus sp. J14TS2]